VHACLSVASERILQGPVVVQLMEVRDISRPASKEAEHSSTGGLLRVVVTDGENEMSGVVLDPVPRLTRNTPPGTKLRLQATAISSGFLLLSGGIASSPGQDMAPRRGGGGGGGGARNGANCEVLGGCVSALEEKWHDEKLMLARRRSEVLAGQSSGLQGDGPPAFQLFHPATCRRLVHPDGSTPHLGETAAAEELGPSLGDPRAVPPAPPQRQQEQERAQGAGLEPRKGGARPKQEKPAGAPGISAPGGVQETLGVVHSLVASKGTPTSILVATDDLAAVPLGSELQEYMMAGVARLTPASFTTGDYEPAALAERLAALTMSFQGKALRFQLRPAPKAPGSLVLDGFRPRQDVEIFNLQPAESGGGTNKKLEAPGKKKSKKKGGSSKDAKKNRAVGAASPSPDCGERRH